MDDFNTSIKNIDGNSTILNGNVYVAKNHKLTVNVNGSFKSLTIKNLPLNYTAYSGVYGKEIHNVEGKKVYARFYVKVIDPFGREINDFRSNHHLQNGLDIEFTSNNTLGSKVRVVGYGVYEPINNVYSLKVFDGNPIEIKEVSQETKSTNDTSSSDASTWIILGGIVGGIIILFLIIWWFYGDNPSSVINQPIYNPIRHHIDTRMLY
jgi:hypothetical protein